MKIRNHLLRAGLTGLAAGIVAFSIIAGGILAKIKTEDYCFKKWIRDAENERAVVIEENGKSKPSYEYVCMSSSRKAKRELPLCTEGIESCCALVLDNKKEGTHYLGHFTAWDDEESIFCSITNNFSDVRALQPYVIAGTIPNSIATKNVYRALKRLNILKNARYCKSESVLVKEGRLYEPVL